jgi:ferric-dicitrate binding protein FerR (iron transport regulator)
MLLRWVQENESHLHQFGQMESIWNALEILKNSDGFNADNTFDRLAQKMKAGTFDNKHKTNRLPVFDYIIRIAAILVIAVILPFQGYQLFFGKNHSGVIRKFELFTPKGSRSLVTLPDGTHIWLNSESRLTYPERFEGKTREVYLEGEGYFTVAKDAKHPFIVKTSHINIKVLGTTFNVKSYPSENVIQTTLVEGSVDIENQNNETGKTEVIRLKPKQQATFIRSSGSFEKVPAPKTETPAQKTTLDTLQIKQVKVDKDINLEAVTSWKDNRLYFENELFKTIAVKLERRFGVTIYFTDPEIVGFRFSGRFDQISIEEALAALKFASDFQYTIDKEKIYIGLKSSKTPQ